MDDTSGPIDTVIDDRSLIKLPKRKKPTKTKKEDKVNRITQLHKLVRFVNRSINTLVKLSSFLGAVIVVYYCMNIGFYPKGLTLGEIPFLLLALMSFGCLSITGFLLGWLAALSPVALCVWLSKTLLPPAKVRFDQGTAPARPLNALQRRLKNCELPREVRIHKDVLSWPLIAISVLAFLMWCILLVMTAGSYFTTGPQRGGFMFVIAVLGSGIFLMGIHCRELAPTPDSEAPVATEPRQSYHGPDGSTLTHKAFATLAVFIAYLIIGSPEFFTNGAMRFIGIRIDRTAVEVSNENYTKIQIASQAAGASFCALRSEETGIWTVFGVDVLWHRGGDQAYIHIPDEGQAYAAGRKGLSLAVSDSGLTPVVFERLDHATAACS